MVADLVAQRFHAFGAVARACLSTSAEFVKEQQEEIESTVKSFKDFATLRAILNRGKDYEQMYYSICHVEPKEKPTWYMIIAPTPFVKGLVLDRLRGVPAKKRREIIDCLTYSSDAESFRGTVFEYEVLDKLRSGCTFTAQRLGGDHGDSVTMSFTFELSSPDKAYCYFNDDSALSSGAYYSIYYREASSGSGQAPACLFQVTMTESHPVSGVELVGVLRKLELLEKVREDPARVALVFAARTGIAQNFERQEIELDGLLGDGDGVRCIDGVGAAIAAAMKEEPINVRTIGELQVYLRNSVAALDGYNVVKRLPIGRLRTLLTKHDEMQAQQEKDAQVGASLKDVLESIPQFVWGESHFHFAEVEKLVYSLYEGCKELVFHRLEEGYQVG